MRKTLAQLILLLAFLCVAWIALQTVWKSTAPIPEGFVSSFQVGDSVILKDDPNPNRPRIGMFDSKCLDSQPKGSVGKVTEINHNERIMAVTCNNNMSIGIYVETDLIKYSEPAPASAATPTYNTTYNPTSLPVAKQRVYECKSGNAFGIKRADQCRCLPGYIPYKTDCGTYVCQNTSDSTVIKNCY